MQDCWVLKVEEFSYLLNLERIQPFYGARVTPIRPGDTILREVTDLHTKGAV